MKTALAAMIVAIERLLRNRPDRAGRSVMLITSDEEGDAVDGTAKVIEHLQRDGTHIDYCIVGEPSSNDAVGDMVRVGPSRFVERSRADPRDPGSRRVSREGAQPDPPCGTRDRRTDESTLGRRQRLLPGDEFPDLQRTRRHRCDERGSGNARAAVQLPLQHRTDRRIGCAPRSPRYSRAIRLDADVDMDAVGSAVSDEARPAGRRSQRKHRRGNRRRRRSCRPAAARPTDASSRRPARKSSKSASSTRRFTRSTNASPLRTSTGSSTSITVRCTDS